MHTQAAVPLASGSGCSAYCQALTDRTPCARTAASPQASGAQARSPAGPDTSFGAVGRPVVRPAGTSSPRSVSRCVPEAPVSCSACQEVQAPVCWTGLASGPVTPPVRPRFRAPAAGFIRSRSAAPRTQGAVR
ncbi:hypothetical protein GCM10010510_03260 [Streptomyces anandii JCM 4720]|nr:hypothetical protein GCM10010510_03260 [Streptomyces anandii JCM 4720]